MPAISKSFTSSAAIPKVSSDSESVWITWVTCIAGKEIKRVCPNYLVGSAVIVFKIHNWGRSEQAHGKWRDKGLEDLLL